MTSNTKSPHFLYSQGQSNSDDMNHYLVYSTIGLFILNIILLLYISYKLYLFKTRKPSSSVDKQNRRYRGLIFGFIFLALIIRGSFEITLVIYISDNPSSTVFSSIGTLIDSLPILLFISIASAFSYFWHEIYSSFDEHLNFPKQSRSWRLKFILILINVALYLGYIALVNAYICYQWQSTLVTLHSVCLLSLIFCTVLLKINGSNLYNKVLTLVSYTGRNVRSSRGFRLIYIILMVCCILRCIKECISIYFAVVVGENIFKAMTEAEGGAYLSLLILYIVLFYVLGEYGLFFSLIKLLDFYADKAKVTCSTIEGHPDSRVSLIQDRLDENPISPYLLN
jgi:hypothetical protein